MGKHSAVGKASLPELPAAVPHSTGSMPQGKSEFPFAIGIRLS
jgi:hypothetical protein